MSGSGSSVTTVGSYCFCPTLLLCCIMQTVSEVREWLDQVPPPRCPALEEFTGIVKAFDDARRSEDRRSSLRAALKYFCIPRSRKSKEPALHNQVRTAIVTKGNAMHDGATNESPAAKARPAHNPHKRDLQSHGDAEQLANSSHSNEEQPPKKVRTCLKEHFAMHTPEKIGKPQGSKYIAHDGENWESHDDTVLCCAIQNIPNVSKVLKRLTRYHGFQLFDLLANIRNV